PRPCPPPRSAPGCATCWSRGIARPRPWARCRIRSTVRRCWSWWTGWGDADRYRKDQTMRFLRFLLPAILAAGPWLAPAQAQDARLSIMTGAPTGTYIQIGRDLGNL